MVTPGQLVKLRIEKPAAGGRMIARADGQVVLVGGTIPGERVTARVERVAKGVAYAETASIDESSPDRRDSFPDPLCGGCLYAHIAYARQLTIKAEVIADAFSRIAHIPLERPIAVVPSKDEGYRMRARLHVRGTRLGFFREGTHEVCDARGTRQLLPATCDLLDRLGAGWRSLGLDGIREIELSENIDASERVVQLDSTTPVDASSLGPGLPGNFAGLTGLTLGGPQAAVAEVMGTPTVSDILSISGKDIAWRRHVLAFFQGNRYLLGDLVAHVVDRIEPASRVIDLYAGGGLFSVASAVVRGARVTAVEGDRIAASDLKANAAQAGGLVEAVHQAVETFAFGTRDRFDTLILDPPRTGMSKEAMAGAVSLRARQIVYVSCDVATLARDARRLVDGGYQLRRIDAFDMFPNTPHVETVAEFGRQV
jgi:23S rRNA (uracil1939-C5)-methyltransferase